MADGNRIIVAFGSNIAAAKNLPAALDRLRAEVPVEGVSRVYETAPVDAPGTPDFLNAAVLVRAERSPYLLKIEVLRPIEAALGRQRGADPNAPRRIDLDIVWWAAGPLDDRCHGLHLPDPNLTELAHLARPASELVPDWLDPVSGRTLAEIAADLSQPYRVVELPGWEPSHPDTAVRAI